MTERSINKTRLLVLTVAAAAAASAQAAPITYYADATTTATPDEERASFLAATTAVSSDGFETAPTGVPIGPISMFGGAGALSQDANGLGSILQGVSANGRTNTTPGCDPNVACKWWETATSFQIALGAEKSAFGFYATDLGDLGGSISLDFWNDAALIRSGIAVSQPTLTSGLLFFGFIDDTFVFNRVSVNVAQTEVDPDRFDYVGFDDVLAGSRAVTAPPPPPPSPPPPPAPTPIPEPATLGLVAASLGMLALNRRRRSRK